MYVVAYKTSRIIYHAKPICYVCNRRLFSLSPESKMAQEEEFFYPMGMWHSPALPLPPLVHVRPCVEMMR